MSRSHSIATRFPLPAGLRVPSGPAVRGAAAAIALAALGSATADEHRWWSPSGSPVTGRFWSSANWDGFDLPSTNGAVTNRLVFSFASPADFEAENDLADPLLVDTIVYDNGDRSGVIWGDGLGIVRLNCGPSIRVNSGELNIESTLSGGCDMDIFGQGILRLLGPNLRDGATIQHGATVEVSGGNHLGSLDSRYVLHGGTFRAVGSTNVSIPFAVTGGTIEAASQLQLAQPLTGTGQVTKAGLGDLMLNGTGSPAALDWTIAEGTVIAGPNALGATSLRMDGGLLILNGPNDVGGLDGGDGTLSIGGQLARTTGGLTPAVTGGSSGVLEVDGPDGAVLIPGDMSGFGGTLRLTNGAVTLDDGPDPFPAGMGLDIGPGGAFTVDTPGLVTVGGLSGTGFLDLRAPLGSSTDLRIGGNGAATDFAGQMLGNFATTLRTSGPTVLRGDATGFVGPEIRVEASELSATTVPALGRPRLRVEHGATFRVPENTTNRIWNLRGSGEIALEPGARLIVDGGTGLALGDHLGPVTSADTSSEIRMDGMNGHQNLLGDLSGYLGEITVERGRTDFAVDQGFGAASQLTLEMDTEVRASGDVTTTIVNRGRILSDDAGTGLVLRGTVDNEGGIGGLNDADVWVSTDDLVQPFFGFISTTSGIVFLDGAAGARVSGGVIQSGPPPSGIRVVGGRATVDDVRMFRRTDIDPGSTLVIETELGGDSLTVADTGATIELAAGAAILNSGTTELLGDGRVHLAGPAAEIGVEHTLRGSGRIDGAGAMTVHGTIIPDGLELAAAVTLSPAAILDVQLEEAGAGRVHVSPDGNVVLGGTLRVALGSDFVAAPGDRIPVITVDEGSAILAGTFDAFELPTVGGLRFVPDVHAEGVDLLVECGTDIDGDGETGITDLIGVLAGWGACPDCPADLNGDDVVDLNDLLAILSGWGACV